ncbi:MAG TPA: ABC transporter ATP-binding protein [Chloroflexota bacterium]|nr:ABC transporter ATP-binding protein [Chloroflexota bacterium]
MAQQQIDAGTRQGLGVPEQGSAVIDARGLSKRYGSLTAVDDISFQVLAGEIFGLLGPNGAGKTTTLEMLEGLRTPDSGDATVLGESVVRHSRRVKERIGVQLQATALPPKTTVAEAIDLFGSFYSRRRPTDELLREADLVDRSTVYSEDLSGGQKQRLSIALALVNDPDLVFLDEPTTGLDPQARLNLWDIIAGIHERNKTVMLTTHYMEEAERLCDRVAVMDHGKIVALDAPGRLIARYAPGTSIEFETDQIDEPALRAIPGIDRMDVEGSRVTLHTEEPEQVMGALFEPDAPWAPAVRSMRDLRVRTGTLEDVFIALTGRTLRS